MPKPSTMSAGQVLDVLRAKHFHGTAFAFLREVRNETGFGSRRTQYADALAVSCWPSRGIWFAGIEVKVSRSDWLHELKQPEKSADIQRFCSYWWVATPDGVVQPGELPETWGHIVVDKKNRTVAKEAPRLTAEPVDITFVASVFRNFAKDEQRLKDEYERGKREALNGEPEPEVDSLQRALTAEKTGHQYVVKQLSELRLRVHELEQATGLSIEHDWLKENVPIIRTAKALLAIDAGDMAQRMRAVADKLTALHESLPSRKDAAE